MPTRPNALGLNFAAATGHPAATMAAIEILDAGGNAFDAAAAAGVAMAVAHPDLVTFFGVAAVMVRSAQSGHVASLAGVGGWPRAATLEHFLSAYGGTIPNGLPRTVVPGAPDAWLAGLERFGTLGFAEIAAPAIRLARRGCPVTDHVAESFAHYANDIAKMPSSTATYFRNSAPPRLGDVLVLEELASTLTFLTETDRAARSNGRSSGLQAVRDAIYRGDVAKLIAAYHRQNGGLLTADDLAAFRVDVEPAISIQLANAKIAVCGPWCQSPVFAQLALLSSARMEPLPDPDGEPFLHLFAEVVKLAMADRTNFIGDPAQVDVPIRELLDPRYAAARASLIGERAMPDMPPPGAPRSLAALGVPQKGISANGEAPASANTAGIAVVDRDGNLCAATVSDVAVDTPVIPGLGCPVSSRGSQGWLEPSHPGVVAPGRRPWLTAAPAIIELADGAQFAIASAGGDVQPQAMFQTFLRMARGTEPQSAVDAPRMESRSFPDAFWPHSYQPGLLRIEEEFASFRVPLEARGHRVQVVRGNDARMGAVVLAGSGRDGLRKGAADARRDSIALAK